MRLIAACLIAGLVLAGCGSDDDESPGGPTGGADVDDATGGVPGGEGGDGEPDGGGEIAAPAIDPLEMPPAGDVRFEIEGATHDFSAADAAQGPAYSCTVESSSITVELQTQPGQLTVQANRGDQQPQWQGSITIAPPDTDRIYSTTPGVDGTFAVDGSMAVYEGEFTWRTNADPALREPAGTGTVLISC